MSKAPIAQTAARLAPGLDGAAALRRIAAPTMKSDGLANFDVGAQLPYPFAMIHESSEVGFRHLIEFKLAERALGTDNPMSLALFEHRVLTFRQWAQGHLRGHHLDAFNADLRESVKYALYPFEKAGLAATKLSRVAQVPDAARVVACFSGINDFLNELASRGTLTAVQRSAMETFQRMLAVTPHQVADWEELVAYLAEHAKKISADAAKLHKLLEQQATAKPGSSLAKSLPKKINEVSGFRNKIKGFLGEIYLANWHRWHEQLEFAFQNAQRMARFEMSPGYEAVRISGGLKIDGREAWDAAVLLINRRERSVVLHTAAQVKVEKELSALKQIIRDRLREVGKDKSIPRVEVLINGRWEKFVLQKLPDGAETERFIFAAQGAKTYERHMRRLEGHMLQSRVMEMDIPYTGFDNLSHQLMFAVEAMVKAKIF